MSGGGGFIGDIVGGVGDIIGGVGDVVGDVVGGVADVAKNLDIEDAAKTYILSGGPFNPAAPYAAAVASTNVDEKLGFNPASFYNPTTGSFGFDTSFVAGDNPFGGSIGLPDLIPGGGIGGGTTSTWNKGAVFENLAKTGIEKLASFAQKSPEQAPQYAQTGTRVLESMSAILADVAAGKYSKSPASEYNTKSVMAAYLGSPDSSNTSGLLSDYNNAKTKINSIISNRSNVGKLAINESPFYNFLTSNKIGQSQGTQRDIFKPYLQQRGLI